MKKKQKGRGFLKRVELKEPEDLMTWIKKLSVDLDRTNSRLMKVRQYVQYIEMPQGVNTTQMFVLNAKEMIKTLSGIIGELEAKKETFGETIAVNELPHRDRL